MNQILERTNAGQSATWPSILQSIFHKYILLITSSLLQQTHQHLKSFSSNSCAIVECYGNKVHRTQQRPQPLKTKLLSPTETFEYMGRLVLLNYVKTNVDLTIWPFCDIPTAKHFFSRQNWQLFRLNRVISHFPSFAQWFVIPCIMQRRKKP